jgi:hypothetical protein
VDVDSVATCFSVKPEGPSPGVSRFAGPAGMRTAASNSASTWFRFAKRILANRVPFLPTSSKRRTQLETKKPTHLLAARRSWVLRDDGRTTPRRKRGPVALRPRLSPGLLFSGIRPRFYQKIPASSRRFLREYPRNPRQTINIVRTGLRACRRTGHEAVEIEATRATAATPPWAILRTPGVRPMHDRADVRSRRLTTESIVNMIARAAKVAQG